MRATRSSAAERRSRRGADHAQQRELLALLSVTLVVLAGLLLVYRTRSAGFAESQARLASKQMLDLNAGPRPEALLPFLETWPNEADRRFVARRIYDESARRRLPNVGALARIRISLAEIESAPGLRDLRARAIEIEPDATTRARATEITLPLLTNEQFAELKPFFVVREPREFRRSFWLHVWAYLAAIYALHLLWRWRRSHGDPLLLPVAHLLTGIGFVLMTSMRDPLRDMTLFAPFASGAAVGCAVLWLFSLPSYQHAVLRRLSFVPLAAALVLSALLIVFGSGPGSSDAKVNFLGLQPVEAIRILLVLFLAGYFAERWEALRELHEKDAGGSWILQRLRLPRFAHLMPLLAGVGLCLAFFFLQKDLGPALVFCALFLVLYAVSRKRVRLVTAALVLVVMAFWVSAELGYPHTVALRVRMWRSPWENGLLRGDQIAHSLWGFSSGGTTGTGPGLGMPNVIPAAHTDLVLSAAGEELGFLGILTLAVAYFVLVQRGLRIARRAAGDYTFFLGLGLTVSIALQVLLIAAGVLGLLPLSGVVTPFVSYGRSALLANFAVLGILRSISSHRDEKTAGEITAPFHVPVRVLGIVLAALGVIVVGRAAQLQVVRAGDVIAASNLVMQADGVYRYQDNPRLREMASFIPRGNIYDRNGLLLATSDWAKLEEQRAKYDELGVPIDQNCRRSDARLYPLAGITYHLLGDLNTRVNWAASNTSFVERDAEPRLRGFGAAPAVVVHTDGEGKPHRVLKYDYREVVPLWRYRFRPRHPDVQKLLNRERNVRLTVDARLQIRAAARLREHVLRAEKQKGAVVVLDPKSGDLLACVSYPWPRRGEARLASASADTSELEGMARVDRARYGLYPPGSAFKLAIAAAALRKDPGLARRTFVCRPLSDGRVGNVVLGRAVRDDRVDREPHGSVDLHDGLVTSCNAYFAQLGIETGLRAVQETADLVEISLGQSPRPEQRGAHLRDASYGQGTVVATPFKMARLAGIFASEGKMAAGRWMLEPLDPRQREPRVVLNPAETRQIATDMRDVVRSPRGTAHKSLGGAPNAIAGKTGTAEVQNAPSHSWFVGFAPYGTRSKNIAFAVLIENGGYGAGAAAPLAGDIVAAARDLDLVH